MGEFRVRRTFVLKMLLGATIPLLMTLGSGVALYLALQSSLETSSQTLQTQAMIAGANNLKLRMADAETGQRGFIVTGKEEYLLPYEQALVSYELIYDRVMATLEDHPDQRERLISSRHLFERWQLEVAIPSINSRRNGNANADLQRFDQGKQLADSYRIIMDELTETANALLRNKQLESVLIGHRANLIAVIGFGSALLTALILWLLLANRTSLAVNGITLAAKRMTEGDWRTRAPELGNDELAAMASAFNLMAERLENMVGAENRPASRSLIASRIWWPAVPKKC